MEYAGFWVRLRAILIDLILFLPVACVYRGIDRLPLPLMLFLAVLFRFSFDAYRILTHWRMCQTLGKCIVRIKVVNSDGSRIGMGQAILREVWSLGLGLVAFAFLFYVLVTWEGPGWSSLSVDQRRLALAEQDPSRPWLSLLSSAWFIAEIVVLLGDRRNRAVHDFIAGTVVRYKSERTTSTDYKTPELAKQKGWF